MSEAIARLAEKYIKCPSFALTLHEANPLLSSMFTVLASEIQGLAGYCLAHQEKLEPSVSVSKIRNMLRKTEWVDTIEGLRNLIDEAEKDGAK